MWLNKLTIQNCRILDQIDLELDQHANFLHGANASGKSSVLEALALLARGRSFRTPRIQEVIQRGAAEVTVSARVEEGQLATSYPLGISKNPGNTRIRINHADVQQQAELSAHIPLTLVHPGSVELITGSPAGRRAFLDWIAFYRFADFHATWRQYQRVLKQRNVCLRDPRQRYALPQWTEQLIALQPALYRFRIQALEALNLALQTANSLLETASLPTLQLSSGFPQGVNPHDQTALQQCFLDRQEAELKQGFSLYGAHRADLHILLQNIPAVRVASRGQLKLLAVGLLLAQSHAVSELPTKRGIIAIDDLAAELDEHNQEALYQTLKATQQQLFITSTRPDSLKNWGDQARVFHVKQGRITAV